jgi:hypothetical protein
MLCQVSWGWVYIRRHTHVCQYSCITSALACVLCGANMLHRELRALIAASLLSKTVASTTYLHTPFSAPKTYMCICASLCLKNKPISSQTRPTYACTCVHILICTCIRLLAATVLDKCFTCMPCCPSARQDAFHHQSGCARAVQQWYVLWHLICVCVCVCVRSDLMEREKERAFCVTSDFCVCVCVREVWFERERERRSLLRK